MQAMTVPVKVGHVPVGFLELFFDAAGTAAFGSEVDDVYLKVSEVAEVLGDSIILRRVRTTHENSLKALESAQSISSDIFPDHVVRALEARQKMRESVMAQKSKRRGASGWQFAAQAVVGKGLGKEAAADGAGAAGALAGGPSGAGAPASMLAAQRHQHGSGPRAVSSTGSEDNSQISGQSEPSVDLMSDYWPSLTIIFADVVGFTEISNHKDPVSTMALLNNLFTRFDSLTISHGVYKARASDLTNQRVRAAEGPPLRLSPLRALCFLAAAESVRSADAPLFAFCCCRLRRSGTATWRFPGCSPRGPTTPARRCGSLWTCTARPGR